MGRKSRAKKEAKRNVTEFIFSGGDKEYRVSEFHPDGTKPSDGNTIRKIVWTHTIPNEAVPDFMKSVLHKFPKKRVYLLRNTVSKLIVGFYPPLEESEKEFVETLVSYIGA